MCVCLTEFTDVKVNAKSKLNPFAFLMHGPGLLVNNSVSMLLQITKRQFVGVIFLQKTFRLTSPSPRSCGCWIVLINTARQSDSGSKDPIHFLHKGIYFL